MRYTRLGKTKLDVSVLALGTWAFGGEWGSFDKGEAQGAINLALDQGITLFDTAQAYGFGVSERLLGESLWKRVRRDEVIVASKGGLRMEGSTLCVMPAPDGCGRASRPAFATWPPTTSTCTRCTGRIRTRRPRRPPPPSRSWSPRARSCHSVFRTTITSRSKSSSRHGQVETLQPPYHMFRRDIEVEVLPYTAANDIGVLAYGPLAHGLLAGRMTTATIFPPDDWRSHSPDFAGDQLPPQYRRGRPARPLRRRTSYAARPACGGVDDHQPRRGRGDRRRPTGLTA